jgi:N,N'-diacetyllegionaminate synthase
MNKTKLIAEVGSNYGGSLNTALEYIRAVKLCGADIVKFQTLSKEKLISPKIWSADGCSDNPVYLQFSNLALPEEWHFTLKKAADEQQIEFMSTPFYLEAVDLLERVDVDTYKIASGDITFRLLLEKVGRTGKKVIFSTGGSSLQDVEKAIKVLKQAGAGDITLLHCVSNYPPQWSEMNLRAIVTLRDAFGLPVGISDHTPGAAVPIAAVALGATVIEKHVTFDRSLPGPDHPFAMTMEEFADMVRQVRDIEEALGTGEKVPADSERIKQHRMRRGVYDPQTLEPVSGDNGIWLRPQHPLTMTNKV